VKALTARRASIIPRIELLEHVATVSDFLTVGFSLNSESRSIVPGGDVIALGVPNTFVRGGNLLAY
jgi:hypothetical protein